MRKSEKERLVADFEETLREKDHLVLCAYRGLAAKEMVELRRAIRGAGGELRVVKKRLFQRALGEGDKSGLAEHMEGPVAVTFVSGDPAPVLKEMASFARTHEELEFKGGWIEGQLVDGGQVTELASLPPREELLGRLLACLSAPLSQLVGALQAVPRDLALTLDAIVKQREGETGAAAEA